MKVGFAIVTHQSDICPSGNKDAHEFIESIRQHVKYNYEIYLIDNQSVPKYSEYSTIDDLNYTYIEDQSIKGTIGSWNLAINSAIKNGCDIINLCNNDLLFTDSINKYLKKIAACPRKDTFLFGPITNIGGAPGHFQERPQTEQNTMTEVTKHRIGLNGFMMSFCKEFYNKYKIGDNLLPTGKEFIWDAFEHELRFRIRKTGGREFVLHDSLVLHKKNRSWLTAKKVISGIDKPYWNPEWENIR